MQTGDDMCAAEILNGFIVDDNGCNPNTMANTWSTSSSAFMVVISLLSIT